MKNCILLLLLLLAAAPSFAQTDKEDRKEMQEEKKAASKDKVDYNIFRRQIIGLKEYSDERRRLPALQKANKGSSVKVVAVVDSLSDTEDPKKLTGYIREDVGDNSTNVYEVTFDRTAKKIIAIKPTGEVSEEEKDENATEKKVHARHTAAKKKKAGDDDEDTDEDEKPSKKKQKDEDD